MYIIHVSAVRCIQCSIHCPVKLIALYKYMYIVVFDDNGMFSIRSERRLNYQLTIS